MIDSIDNKLSLEVLHLPLYTAALQRGLDIEIWQQPAKEPELVKLWENLGLLRLAGSEGKTGCWLTDTGAELVQNQSLYRFEMASMERLVGDRFLFGRDRAYYWLRSGLAERTGLTKNRQAFETMLPYLTNDRVNVADFGGGAGGFLRLFLGNGRRVVVDADPAVEDLLDENTQFVELKLGLNREIPRALLQPEGFDVVLCSELLHLMSGARAVNVLRQARALVPPLGHVVVAENWPRKWFSWRLSRLSREGHPVSIEQIREYAKAAELSFRSVTEGPDHYFALLRREVLS